MTMTSITEFDWTEARLQALRSVVEEAGAAVLEIYRRLEPVAVQHKDDHSPLTEADLAADRLIRERLQALFPGSVVLSEESGEATAPGDPAAGYFLVDPLDGTKEFLARNGEFTINVAWVQGTRVQAGAVHAPALGETFWGAAGVGAWKAAAGAGGAGGGEVRPIRVAPMPQAGVSLRVLASRSHGGAAQRAYLSRLPQPHVCVEAGSSLKFCRLAEGAADLYPRLTATMPWDTAAGQAVLEGAGGVVFGTEGAPLRVPRRPRESPNPPFFAASSAELARQSVAVL